MTVLQCMFYPKQICYWTVLDLGVERTRNAKRLNMSWPGVEFAEKKGEKIVKDSNIHDWIMTELQIDVPYTLKAEEVIPADIFFFDYEPSKDP